jgi:large subunit ribosomal protein L17
MPARPRKARRFGGDAAHQRLMMANLVASLIAAEGIVTTEAKAKALRPVAEKVITKAKRAEANPDTKVHQIRLVQSYLGDREMTAKLFDEIGPRYADRNGGYTRVIKAGIRISDAAPIAVIEFVDRDVSAKGQDSGPVMTEEEFEAA